MNVENYSFNMWLKKNTNLFLLEIVLFLILFIRLFNEYC